MDTRNRVRTIVAGVGLGIAAVLLAACDADDPPVVSGTDTGPVEAAPSAPTSGWDYRALPLAPGENLLGGADGQGSDVVVVDTSGAGTYFAVYVQCLGDDLTVENTYAGSETVDTTPCDGVLSRQQFYVDGGPEEVRITVTGRGEWVVAVVENPEIAESVQAE